MFAIRAIWTHGHFRRHMCHTPTEESSTRTKRLMYIMFQKHLALFNGLTSGLFMGLGDLIQQEVEYRYKKLSKRYDWSRLSHMFIVGCVLGPLHHVYYLKLDRVLPGASLKIVFQKIALDQFFAAPLTILCFFFCHGLLDRKDLSQISKEIREKAIYVYLGDWIFWPPTQFVNFYFLPWQYRVVYINFVTMIFNVFLSYIKYDFH